MRLTQNKLHNRTIPLCNLFLMGIGLNKLQHPNKEALKTSCYQNQSSTTVLNETHKHLWQKILPEN